MRPANSPFPFSFSLLQAFLPSILRSLSSAEKFRRSVHVSGGGVRDHGERAVAGHRRLLSTPRAILVSVAVVREHGGGGASTVRHRLHLNGRFRLRIFTNIYTTAVSPCFPTSNQRSEGDQS